MMNSRITYREAEQKIELLKNAPPGSTEAKELKKIVKAVVRYHRKKLQQ